MTTKKSKTSKKLYTRRSYEPLKMTIAVSASAGVLLVAFAVVLVGLQ